MLVYVGAEKNQNGFWKLTPFSSKMKSTAGIFIHYGVQYGVFKVSNKEFTFMQPSAEY